MKIKSIISYVKLSPYKNIFLIGNYAFMAYFLCIFQRKKNHRKIHTSHNVDNYFI